MLKSAKKRRGRKRSKIAYAFLASSFAVIFLIAYYALNSQNSAKVDLTPKAVIVDHLSISQPNPTFSQAVAFLLLFVILT